MQLEVRPKQTLAKRSSIFNADLYQERTCSELKEIIKRTEELEGKSLHTRYLNQFSSVLKSMRSIFIVLSLLVGIASLGNIFFLGALPWELAIIGLGLMSLGTMIIHPTMLGNQLLSQLDRKYGYQMLDARRDIPGEERYDRFKVTSNLRSNGQLGVWLGRRTVIDGSWVKFSQPLSRDRVYKLSFKEMNNFENSGGKLKTNVFMDKQVGEAARASVEQDNIKTLSQAISESSPLDEPAQLDKLTSWYKGCSVNQLFIAYFDIDTESDREQAEEFILWLKSVAENWQEQERENLVHSTYLQEDREIHASYFKELTAG